MTLRFGLRSLGLGFVTLVTATSAASAQTPGRCEVRTRPGVSDVGCYLLDSVPIGHLPHDSVYWHLYEFPSLRAASQAREGKGTAFEAFDRFWLVTVAGQGWRPSSGTRIAVLGPIPVPAGRAYTARYLRSMLTPGFRTRIHQHAGAELFYVLHGAQCVETTAGHLITRSGESATAPPGVLMQLSTYGLDTVRALVLVLHDSDKPWVDRSPVDWQPPGVCP